LTFDVTAVRPAVLPTAYPAVRIAYKGPFHADAAQRTPADHVAHAPRVHALVFARLEDQVTRRFGFQAHHARVRLVRARHGSFVHIDHLAIPGGDDQLGGVSSRDVLGIDRG
jgi:hypothetical protein